MMDYIKNRLKERSTWAGLTSFFLSIGAYFTNYIMDTISTTGFLICSLALIFIPSSKHDEDKGHDIKKGLDEINKN